MTGIDDEGRPPLTKRLMAMIQKERSQPPGVKGEIFDIVFIGDPTTHDRATIGCVYVTEQGYIYPKLVDEEIFDIMIGHYNRAYAENARFAARVVRDELAKGSLANPLPINVIYSEPVYACYPTPMVALNRRFAYKVSYFREPELRETMQGGYAGNVLSNVQTRIDVIKLLRETHPEIASQIENKLRRATDLPEHDVPVFSADVIAGFASGIVESGHELIINVLWELMTITQHRKPGQRAALFVTTDDSKQEEFRPTWDNLRQRLAQSRIELFTGSSPEELEEKLARWAQ